MSLRFAYSSLNWLREELERNLALLAPNGWDGWETRESLDCLGTPSRVRRICENEGIEVAAVTGPNVSREADQSGHEISKRRIEFAAELGVGLFMTKGPGHGDVTPTPDEELDRVAAIYDDLAEHGHRLGVSVCFHPHIRHFVDSAEEFSRFVPRLLSCRLCLDMSHLVFWGLDPGQAARDHADRVAYVHLHDWVDDQPVDLGDGPMCDYRAFLSTVEELFSCWVVTCPGGKRSAADSLRINRDYLRGIGF